MTNASKLTSRHQGNWIGNVFYSDVLAIRWMENMARMFGDIDVQPAEGRPALAEEIARPK